MKTTLPDSEALRRDIGQVKRAAGRQYLHTAIGDELSERMNALGANQAEFAEQAGVSPSALSEWLKGKKLPKPDSLDLLARGIAAMEGRPEDAERVRRLKAIFLKRSGYADSSLVDELVPAVLRSQPDFSALMDDIADFTAAEAEQLIIQMRLTAAMLRRQRSA